MNPRVSNLIDAAIVRSPAQLWFRRLATSRLAVLAYHAIDDPLGFSAHLDVLRRSARPVSLDDVFDAASGRRALPDRAVLITFDDAEATVRDVALPLLRERGIPAVALVVAGSLDSDRPLWPAEVRDLVRSGGGLVGLGRLSGDDVVRALKKMPDETRVIAIERLRSSAERAASPVAQLRSADLPILESAGIVVGNHTMTHACLDRCTEERIREEITAAHEVLAGALGRQPRAFAYPNGDHDDRVVRAVSDAGYEAAFLFDHRMSDAPPADLLRIPRIRANAGDRVDRFRALISGLHPALHAIRTRRSRPAETPAPMQVGAGARGTTP